MLGYVGRLGEAKVGSIEDLLGSLAVAQWMLVTAELRRPNNCCLLLLSSVLDRAECT